MAPISNIFYTSNPALQHEWLGSKRGHFKRYDERVSSPYSSIITGKCANRVIWKNLTPLSAHRGRSLILPLQKSLSKIFQSGYFILFVCKIENLVLKKDTKTFYFHNILVYFL